MTQRKLNLHTIEDETPLLMQFCSSSSSSSPLLKNMTAVSALSTMDTSMQKSPPGCEPADHSPLTLPPCTYFQQTLHSFAYCHPPSTNKVKEFVKQIVILRNISDLLQAS